jgi:hypothetical protein
MSREGYGMKYGLFCHITQRVVVRYYHHMLRDMAEQRRSPLGGRSLKSRMESLKDAHHPAVHLKILRQVMKRPIQERWRY